MHSVRAIFTRKTHPYSPPRLSPAHLTGVLRPVSHRFVSARATNDDDGRVNDDVDDEGDDGRAKESARTLPPAPIAITSAAGENDSPLRDEDLLRELTHGTSLGVSQVAQHHDTPLREGEK